VVNAKMSAGERGEVGGEGKEGCAATVWKDGNGKDHCHKSTPTHAGTQMPRGMSNGPLGPLWQWSLL